MNLVLASALFVATLLLVLIRPRRIGEAWWAAAGGVLALALGLVSLEQAWQIVRLAQDALVFLVGMMILSALAQRAGCFEWAAALAARAGGGRVRRLYLLVFLVGTVITATLSLDTTAIILTPIIFGMVTRLRLRPLPFMFATSYIANTASLFLPISNLTNLLVYNALGLSFIRFGAVMLLPGLLAVAANVAVFSVLFRDSLRGRYHPVAASPPREPAFFRFAGASLALVLVALVAASAVGVPIGLVALAGALLALLVARLRGWMALGEASRAVSWNLIALVLGLFLVVQAVENAGLAGLVQRAFGAIAPGNGLAQILAAALGATIGANAINNIPMTIVGTTALGPLLATREVRPAEAYALLLGTNIGPNLTIVGSLATLIWLNIVRSQGMPVAARSYLRIGLVAVPPILLSAALGLWLSLKLVG